MRKLIKLSMVSTVTLFLTACGASNKFGMHSADYANATECPPVKMPADSLAASTRYEIPAVPASNTSKIITDVSPPDYCKK